MRNVRGDEVTGNYFDVLGVQPALGQFLPCSRRATAPIQYLTWY
ncbi:MAG: hypothetical protein WDO73_35450 [Ignavibacteriota bacterium]